MEKPRDLGDDRPWDSRRVAFDEKLGGPSPFTSPMEGDAVSKFMKAKGISLDFVSDKPFNGKGTYDVFGSGGGGGGRYGSKIVLKDTVHLGLLWLARHQNVNGSWSAATLADRCGRPLPNGREVKGPVCGAGDDETDRLTALGALAFAAAGYDARSPDVWDGLPYRDVVARACVFLSQPGRDPKSRAPALLAFCALYSPPSTFGFSQRRGEVPPDLLSLEELLDAVEADPFPPEGSEEAAWTALALSAAARVGLEVSPEEVERAGSELQRRCEELPAIVPDDWPGENPARTYLRLLASFKESLTSRAELPVEKALYPRLRRGQVREIDACREGSWEPVGNESRLSTTLLHLLALESLPGYAFRAGHPLRPSAEVRAREAMRRAMIQERIDEVLADPKALRRGIKRLREEWLKTKQPISEESISTAFEPLELRYVRFVPKVEIGDHLESDNDEEFMKFKPLGRLGGNRDLITEEVHEGLCEGDGIVGFDAEWSVVVPDKENDLTSLGRTLIFTLPEGTTKPDGTPNWEKYVVIGFYVIR